MNVNEDYNRNNVMVYWIEVRISDSLNDAVHGKGRKESLLYVPEKGVFHYDGEGVRYDGSKRAIGEADKCVKKYLNSIIEFGEKPTRVGGRTIERMGFIWVSKEDISTLVSAAEEADQRRDDVLRIIRELQSRFEKHGHLVLTDYSS